MIKCKPTHDPRIWNGAYDPCNPIATEAKSPMTKALSVLVVDDDDLIAMLLGEMLQEMGYAVCAIAATVADAVIAAARHKPGLMIVDARLGHGSGLRAVDEILVAGFVPHFFMSGNVAKVRALRPDAVVLEKPFQEAQLAHAIQHALRTANALCLARPKEPGL
jgi:two-component system, response regulator PdtaR